MATDAFTGTADPISSSWSVTFADSAGDRLRKQGGVAKADTSGQRVGEYWNADSFNGNHYSEVTITNTAADGGPTVRNGSGDCYICANAGGTVNLYQYNGGAYDSISTGSSNYTASSVYRLTVEGSDLEVTEDGSTTGMPSGTDTSLTGGSPGIAISGSSEMDDWTGLDVATAGGSNFLTLLGVG